MWAFFAAAQYGGGIWLDCHDFDIGFACLQDFAHAGYRAAGTYAGNENVHLAVGVAPYFFGGGFAVDFDVGLVVELARHEIGFGMFVHKCFGTRNRTAHAFRCWCQDQFRTEGAQQHTAFFTHAFGHGDG